MLVLPPVLISGCAKPATQMPAASDRPQLPDGRDGVRKTGTPYMIDGRRYTPMQVETAYDETGVASWYGKDFHGKPTANGEHYDMHTLSAAHKTLPLPTLVRVTNLENGRTVIVRVNDRGPFVKERLIDLSYAAARELGYERQGTAHVRVQTLEAAPVDMLAAGAAIKAREHADMVRVNRPAPLTTVHSGKLFVQLGAFSVQENALRQQKLLLPRHPEAHLVSVPIAGRTMYRVRIGPFMQADQVEKTVLTLRQEGFSDTMVIIE
ncbi:MAG: septal ring lytic transglycosylase RlpA family protein [Zetaproteobacteria bacterium CG12_big_fil_rev_8_21_14_0_65_54_13]|nr:MAG: septal ring lytic transglycosylase RlpA family protein [Zetaproteobacteria bacterium CG12_big_fil_rev_8_21_14_0_65_54_13]PIX53906.1 MAG: septal ring lytic transglycosylase RlpA family protein [Zetaproteobacteria bacterium CG_4_10_14_3_um_filter_54_28]PJA30075.1 MAG: septal ring lytic transglycosylase RlpA family protein [Zetaproteobacteria bacterium CG_4_9_14_3_um_filter_54_145]